MERQRMLLIVSVVVIVTTLLAACGPAPTPTPLPPTPVLPTPTARVVVVTATPAPTPLPTATPGPKKGAVLIFGKAQEAVGLDPHLVTAAASFEIINRVYEPLVLMDEKYAPIPALAEKWESPSDTTFIFTLRKGVKFHNGREMKAADVKYSYERILNPATKSPWASQLAPILAIETPDDYTVKLTLKQPYGALMSTLASAWAAIVPKEEVEKAGDLQKTMVGTGAFMLDKWEKDVQTVLKAFPDYWQKGKPLLGGITYKIMPDEAARLAAVRTGEIQMTRLSSATATGLAARSEGVKVASQATSDYYLLGLNTKRPPLDNVKVRQAISMAIDRKAILDSVAFGEGFVCGPIPSTLGDWAVSLDQLPYYKRDVEKAKALLKEAGLEKGFKLSITASPAYPEFISIALVIQRQLKDVGIEAVLDQVEWGTFITKWRERDFDSFVSYNASGNDPDRALWAALHSKGTVNAFQFSNADVDKLLDQGRVVVDRAKRIAVYKDAQIKIAEQAPLMFLYTRTEYVAYRDVVQAFKLNPVEPFRNIIDAWIK